MPKTVSIGLSPREILERIVRRPVVVILMIAAVTLFFAWQLPRLSFQTTVYDLQIQDLPETTRYQEFKKLFGSDEIIRVVIKSENLFEPVTFQKITQLAQEAEAINGVRRVISLPGIKQAVDVSGKWSLEKFYTVVSQVDLFRKNLISLDRKTTALTLVLNDEADHKAVIRQVEAMIAGAAKDLSLYQVGMPLVSQALVEFTEKDFFRLPPITFLIIAVILFGLFLRIQYLLIPITCVGLSLVWTFGLMAYIGIPLSMITMIVPVFLIAVGTAYCLHIVSEYLSCSHKAGSSIDATMSTFSTVAFPTVIAVLTTIIGLGSLLVNRIPTIREFAVFTCFGMFSILVIVHTLLPAALALIPLPAKGKIAGYGRPRVFDRFIDKIIRLNLDHQKIVLPVLGALVILCLIGILRIRVETNPVGYFKEQTPVKQHFHDIYRDLSGSFPINIVMESKEAEYFEDPQNVAAIARLQDYLETLPGIDKTVSFADYLMLVNYALNRFEPEFYALPEEGFEVRMLINNYTTMLGEDMLNRFMSPDFSKANILLLTHISSSRNFLQTRDKILTFVKQHFPKDLAWNVTGFGIAISASSHQLTRGQIKSLSITMVLVFGIMFLLFLSSKVGLIAIVPNLFPIIINFGFMGWLGIELSMVTSLIASIAIGLAVDDTIHYLFRYNREFKKDLDDRRAFSETLKQVGRPIIFTTLTICAGFSILVFSSFKPTAVFGIMMAITVLSALVGDLILLPSLMQHVELVTLWDLVRLKLGQEPRYGIPLFRGLSRTQVHYIIMAGSLKTLQAGEVLFHKGESSDSMYTIVSGAMDVVDPLTDDPACLEVGNHHLINRLKTGDLLGEMGLLRSVPRSATIIATEPVELLQINWKMIQRLQWLYPPTAHKFFHNLLTIICDRLEKVTACLSETQTVDDTTGLHNRETFLKILDDEIHRAHRYGSKLS
ncbi:MAG: efflux RND transporter permease subunit, partial [Desulfobacterales bacterium]